MENPHGTPVPKTTVAAFEFKDADGFTTPFVVASNRRHGGKWRACFFWHRQHDQRLRDNLLFCFRAWARAELQISDLKRIQFFAARIDDGNKVSRFKIVGAHRELGHLFPVFFLPFAISKIFKPAVERLKLEISGPTLVAANDDA